MLLIYNGLLLLITATVGPLAGGRGRPTDLLAADDAPLASAPAFIIGPQIDSAYSNTILVAEDAGPSRPAGREELAPLDLSGLTPARLLQLEGQRLRRRVVADSGVWRVGDRDVFRKELWVRKTSPAVRVGDKLGRRRRRWAACREKRAYRSILSWMANRNI